MRLTNTSRLCAALLVLVGTAACGDDTLIAAKESPPEPEAPAAPDEPDEPTNAGDICEDNDDCAGASRCDSGTCVGVGVMSVTLRFYTDSDFDLHLILPSGDEIFYGNDQAEGGVLDVDQCVGACVGEAPYIENVVFAENAPRGMYVAYVENYDGRSGGAFDIEVKGDDGETLLTDSGILDSYAGTQSFGTEWSFE